MRYQGLIVVLLGLLPQCSLKKEEAVPASLPQGELLDPSLYTMSAYVMVPYDYKNGRMTGQWSDGKGEFVPGSDYALTRFRYTLTSEQRYQKLQFKMAVGDAEASSGLLSFKDCDFAASLGYPSADFRHMVLSYNFYVGTFQEDVGPVVVQPDPMPLVAEATLERAPFAASGPDALAVRCERIPERSFPRLITLSLATSMIYQLTIEAQGRTLIPMSIDRASYTSRIEQTYSFEMPASTPIADSKLGITVRSPKGTHNYQVSFNRCLAMLDSRERNLLISQHYGLYIDENGVLQDGGGISCCMSDGICSQVIVN